MLGMDILTVPYKRVTLELQEGISVVDESGTMEHGNCVGRVCNQRAVVCCVVLVYKRICYEEHSQKTYSFVWAAHIIMTSNTQINGEICQWIGT